jgi:hypothetical protein
MRERDCIVCGLLREGVPFRAADRRGPPSVREQNERSKHEPNIACEFFPHFCWIKCPKPPVQHASDECNEQRCNEEMFYESDERKMRSPSPFIDNSLSNLEELFVAGITAKNAVF